MTTDAATLDAFSYGEHREAGSGRSLGYRLLAPAEPHSWSEEVDALARHLQSAPYPDRWAPVDLFCSVLLGDGRRLVALARYGLADHTPSPRRGGFELIGLVGPGDLSAAAALAAYYWLKERRASSDDLARHSGRVAVADVRTAAPEVVPPVEALPVLPVRWWQAGTLLFAATSPSDPDHRLALLAEGAGNRWQWLPLIGPDFPLQEYAQRGPLIAWTPHLEGVALKLDARAPAVRSAASRRVPYFIGLLLLLLVLLGANLWALLALPGRIAANSQPASQPPAGGGTSAPVTPGTSGPTAQPDTRDRFARALYQIVVQRGGAQEWTERDRDLLARYERLAHDNPDLLVQDREGKLAVAALSILAGRTADRVEDAVRQALRGLDPQWIRTAVDLVHKQLVREGKEEP